MKLFEYIERINLLNKLIKQSRTGSPNDLAKRLNISSSRLYCIIDDLKQMGAPIGYSRDLCTYFYTARYEMHIDINVYPLDSETLSKINGGVYYLNKTPLLFL